MSPNHHICPSSPSAQVDHTVYALQKMYFLPSIFVIF